MYSRTIRKNYLTYRFHYLVWVLPQQTSWVQPETGSRGAAWRQTVGKFSPKTSGRKSPSPVGAAEVPICCAQSKVVTWQYDSMESNVESLNKRCVIAMSVYVHCNFKSRKQESCYYCLYSESSPPSYINPKLTKESSFQLVMYMVKCLSFQCAVSNPACSMWESETWEMISSANTSKSAQESSFHLGLM